MSRAQDAIGNFDRLSRFEKDVVSRVIWFWPWSRAAWRYTTRFPFEHPAQTVGLAAGARALQQRQQQELGPTPWWADLYLPVGQREGIPRVVDVGSLMPFETPLRWAQTAAGFATGDPNAPQLAEQLTPVLGALGTALYGDRYTGERGIGAGLHELAGSPPLPKKIGDLLKSEAERNTGHVVQRTTTEALGNMFLGRTFPKGYDAKLAAGTAGARSACRARCGRSGRAARGRERGRDQVGLPALPHEVTRAVHWKVGLDASIDRLRRGQREAGNTIRRRDESGRAEAVHAHSEAEGRRGRALLRQGASAVTGRLEAAFKQAARLRHSPDAMERLYQEIRREFLAALAEWHTETNSSRRRARRRRVKPASEVPRLSAEELSRAAPSAGTRPARFSPRTGSGDPRALRPARRGRVAEQARAGRSGETRER